ncbi:MAG TPA: peptidoglycan DD-metalloendopeptidase family protein [Bryobacteraceae bacterium]|nr:peptidoglycan DD-metalloendopeptidase family protein [Bryobacteraceae bacterium]
MRRATVFFASLFLLQAQPKTLSVHQGDAIRVQLPGAQQLQAELNGRSISLFPQPDGTVLGLMPVPVAQPPGTFTLHVRDASGAEKQQLSVRVEDAHFPRQNIQVGKGTAQLKPLPGEMEAVGALRSSVSPTRFWNEPFENPTSDCMNSLFGVARYHNGKPTGNYHKGVDLRSPAGRPIHAVTDGVIHIAKMFRLHGGTVGIDHGQGLTSIYLHMSKIAVEEGQRVKKGDVIGYVGKTGFATGPHLHWQLQVNGLPINPSQFLPNVPRCL